MYKFHASKINSSSFELNCSTASFSLCWNPLLLLKMLITSRQLQFICFDRKPQLSNMTTTNSNSNSTTGGAASSYRITASLKRQKSTSTHPSGQHSVATRKTEQQQQQLQVQQQHDINSQHHCEITQKPGELRKLH